MNRFTELPTSDHERVVSCHDHATGLRAIIAVHDTTLGPALGGLRMWNYASEDEALFDVLRLARGMTYKSAAAGLRFGGGKAVIVGDSRTRKTPALLRRFGEFVAELGGRYITAEDVGIDTHDIEIVREVTPHVAGLREQSGDPSPFTALGVLVSIRAAIQHLSGRDDLSGRRVMVQGVGNVGLHLVRALREAGAEVFACDVNEHALRAAVAVGARGVSASEAYTTPVDVYAPCALGATLNPATIPQLRCAVVCGAANNQLLDDARDGRALHERGILYAPDFVVNAGGIINISVEKSGAYDQKLALRLTEDIRHTVAMIFAKSGDCCLPHETAMRIAEAKLRAARHEDGAAKTATALPFA